MSIARRLLLFACGAPFVACSLDGLTDGRMSTGTGGKGSSSSASGSTGTGSPKPKMFVWARDLGPSPSPPAPVHLASFAGGVVLAASGTGQLQLGGAPCGAANVCLALLTSSGAPSVFADGIGGTATKNVTAIAASTDRIAVAGTFSGGSITFGAGTNPVTFTTAKTQSFIALFDTATHFVRAARLRSDPAGAQVTTLNAVAMDASDNVFVTGGYHDALWLTPPGGTEAQLTGLSTGTLGQGYVLKLSAALAADWQVDFGTTGDNEDGKAIDVGPTGIVGIGGDSRRPSTLGGMSCGDHFSGTPGASVMAFTGFIDPSGTPIHCDSFGGAGSDISGVLATSVGALFAGAYQTTVTWPTLPPPQKQARPAFISDERLPIQTTPTAQSISGDMGSFHQLNAMAIVGTTLFLAGTTTGNPRFDPAPGSCFQSLGDLDGFISVEQKGPTDPFLPPKGLIIGSPKAETIDAMTALGDGEIIVAGSYSGAFDLLPAPVTSTDMFVGRVNTALLTSPACH